MIGRETGKKAAQREDREVSHRLEEKLQGELEIARAARAEDRVEACALVDLRPQATICHSRGDAVSRIVEGTIFRSELGVIEHIEHIGLQAKTDALMQGEFALQGKVEFL
jgi:hypothetical protein